MMTLKPFVPPRSTVLRCKRCHEQIFFVAMADNDKVPVNLAPSTDGDLSVTERPADQYPFAVVVKRAAQREGMKAAGLHLYVKHLNDCPYADQFRKQARSRGKWKK